MSRIQYLQYCRSLSTQVYKMGTDNILLGVTLQWTSIPSGGVAILSVASCYRNRVKLQLCRPPWLVCVFTYL